MPLKSVGQSIFKLVVSSRSERHDDDHSSGSRPVSAAAAARPVVVSAQQGLPGRKFLVAGGGSGTGADRLPSAHAGQHHCSSGAGRFTIASHPSHQSRGAWPLASRSGTPWVAGTCAGAGGLSATQCFSARHIRSRPLHPQWPQPALDLGANAGQLCGSCTVCRAAFLRSFADATGSWAAWTPSAWPDLSLA